jgi:hypothetical protein
MSDSALTLRAWNPQQQRVARWIALGLSQSEAARRESVALRTVQYWVANNDLLALADELHARGWERVDPQLWANLEHALLIQSQVFAGERDRGDPAYVEARRFIETALAYRAGGTQPRRGQSDREAS